MTKFKDLRERWMEDSAFKVEYDTIKEEFALANALIPARLQADMTLEQVATAMGTSRAAAARLESGRPPTTTKTLERFARATGMRLRFSFEPEQAGASRRPRSKAWHANFLESLACLCYVVAQR